VYRVVFFCLLLAFFFISRWESGISPSVRPSTRPSVREEERRPICVARPYISLSSIDGQHTRRSVSSSTTIRPIPALSCSALHPPIIILCNTLTFPVPSTRSVCLSDVLHYWSSHNKRSPSLWMDDLVMPRRHGQLQQQQHDDDDGGTSVGHGK